MSTSFYTALEEIPKIHQRARDAYRSGKLKSIEYRREQIAQVGYLLKDNEQRFIDALRTDLGRPAQETIFLDFAAVYIDVKTAYDNVAKWTRSERATFSLNFFVMSPRLRPEPKGVVLAIAPFNAPIFMLLAPLVGAIAGGNAVVLKPSEQSPEVAKLFAELVPKYLDQDLFHVINGGIPETTRVLELPWNHIIYTGNGRVARIISAAAAKHLTPTTLELGGKNPVVVDPKCDVQLAARRILWGRTCNAGQVCLAPEYVLLPESFQDTFVEALKAVYRSFYPDGAKDSDSFCRIVTEAHTARIKDLIDRTKGTVVFGGDVNIAEREIFGPVLLLVPVKDVDEALDIINSKDHPLAIYAFSSDQAFLEKVFDNTESGAAVANEVVISIGVPGLPMGGVGASGHGYYTGKHMFDEFTHLRVSLNNPGWVDKIAFGFRFPPYKVRTPLRLITLTPEKEKQLRALSPSLPPRPSEKKHGATMIGSWSVILFASAVSVVLLKSGWSLPTM
ncbi:NAD-aldehyde dehydrogenase [Cubamyces lactineus]|nr:NAD-aldehyde dehydrogenase [Cubamyces lactineus]